MKQIFLSPPHMSGNEQKYIQEVFASNYIAPLGEFVDRFEESIKSYTGAQYAVALSSATAAIHLALKVLGVKENDEILASSFTFIGSVAPVTYEKCKPIFIESDTQSWNLSPELLEEFLAKRKGANKIPKVLILTHLYGQCADIEKIFAICKAYGVLLIEDAAESLGAHFHNKQTGTFADIGVYSFNGNKILTTSGGGVLVTNTQKYASKAKFLATQARDPSLHYEHSEVGYNYRLSNVLGAIGVGQMEVLEKRVTKKRAIFSTYQKLLGHLEISFMPELENSQGNRWLTTLTFNTIQKEKVIEILEKNSIESRPLWKPMHMQPVFKECEYYGDRVSEELFAKGLCLPSGTELTQSDLEYITDLIKKVKI